MPKVSILIPAYNNPGGLKRALESCLNQTYSDYEIIITDDSTNNECSILTAGYQKNNAGIKYFHNAVSLGPPKNWNYALAAASGRYIKFLHHDDWFSNVNSLEKYAAALDNNPEAGFAYSKPADVFEDGSIRYHDFSGEISLIKEDIYALFPDNYIGAPSNTIYINKGILFDEKLKWLVDLDFYIRILEQNKNFVYINENLVYTGISSSQVTNSCVNNIDAELFENFRVYNKFAGKFKNKKDKIKVLKELLEKYNVKKLSYLKTKVKGEKIPLPIVCSILSGLF